MVNHVIGIDPGQKGAIAVLDGDGRIVNLYDMPTEEVKVGGTLRPRVVTKGLHELLFSLAELYDTPPVNIERVGPAPRDSRAGAFTFGQLVGTLHGLAYATGFSPTLVVPQTWKRVMGVPGSDKKKSLAKARTRWADQAHRFFTLEKHEGRSEACLLALYGVSLEGAKRG